MQEMEALLDRLERLGDPSVREDARALVAGLLRLHGSALARLVEITTQTPAGPSLLAAWKENPEVAALLLLHGLHPDDLSSRVHRALARVQPLADFLGVGVHAGPISESRAQIELTVASDVPRHALAELQEQIERAFLELAPEVQAVEFEGAGRRVALPLVGPAGRERT
jgi:hypothetical protein